MNSAQAKQIKIVDFLNKIQIFSKSEKKNENWYLSPLHTETTPSFKVDTNKNLWYDHGLGSGGTIIDLVMALYNLNFTDALKKLDNQDIDFSFSQAKKEPQKIQKKSEIEIKKIQDLQNLALVEYLIKRGFKSPLKLFNSGLKEVYCSQNNKTYFSIAFKNDSDGYETRNPYFKGCIDSKDITTIKGIDNSKLSIFEGFMDYFSALEYYQIDSFKSDVVVLNSVSNKSKINELLNSNKYSKIYLFLDNDRAGNETKIEFFNINKNCINCSKIYKNFKDFNEFLVSKKV